MLVIILAPWINHYPSRYLEDLPARRMRPQGSARCHQSLVYRASQSSRRRSSDGTTGSIRPVPASGQQHCRSRPASPNDHGR